MTYKPCRMARKSCAPALFICHASKDARMALRLVAKFERLGVRCWIAPRNIAPGAEFAAQIFSALKRCRAVLLIYSARCHGSRFVQSEVTVATNLGKPVIPIRIENVDPEGALALYLATLHWVDAFEAVDRAVDDVLRALQRQGA